MNRKETSPPRSAEAGLWVEEQSSFLLTDDNRALLESTILPEYLALQRGFGGKNERGLSVSICDVALKAGAAADLYLLLIDTAGPTGSPERYFVPFVVDWRAESPSDEIVCEVGSAHGVGRLRDALDTFSGGAGVFLEWFRGGGSIPMQKGELHFRPTGAWGERVESSGNTSEAHVSTVASSTNTVLRLGGSWILKVYRRVERGPHPEAECAEYLEEEISLESVPRHLGTFHYESAEGETTTLGIVQEAIDGEDAWDHTAAALRRTVVGGVAPKASSHGIFGESIKFATSLGDTTASLHLALSGLRTAPSFGSPFRCAAVSSDDLQCWSQAAIARAQRVGEQLADARTRLSTDDAHLVDRLSVEWEALLGELGRLPQCQESGGKIRCHGDYHLGQVLIRGDDLFVIDFEGEPERSLAERRSLASPLKDVASMVRSFSYAIHAFRASDGGGRLHDWEAAWEETSVSSFLRSYRECVGKFALAPSDTVEFNRLLNFFLIEKAVYELGYELAYRPDWVNVPASGLLALLTSLRRV